MAKNTKYEPVRRKDMCRSLWMFGLIDDFSKATCLHYADKLAAKVDAGEVEKIKEGHTAYYRIRPDVLDRLDQHEMEEP